jgi:hypothetical protein
VTYASQESGRGREQSGCIIWIMQSGRRQKERHKDSQSRSGRRIYRVVGKLGSLAVVRRVRLEER